MPLFFADVVPSLSTTGAWLGVAAGAALLARAARLFAIRRKRPRAGPENAWLLVRAFRVALVGSALVCVGAGLLAEIAWLVLLAVIIGAQELFETSIMSAALGDEVRRREQEAAS